MQATEIAPHSVSPSYTQRHTEKRIAEQFKILYNAFWVQVNLLRGRCDACVGYERLPPLIAAYGSSVSPIINLFRKASDDRCLYLLQYITMLPISQGYWFPKVGNFNVRMQAGVVIL